ncbi:MULTISPECIES: hypothetical protein [Cytobacillus]
MGYECWNPGYGTEGIKGSVEFGFRYMNIHKITADITLTIRLLEE